jgi:hypothetical protein
MVLTSVSYRPPFQEDEACAQQFDHLIGTNQTGSLSNGEVHTDHIPFEPVSVASPTNRNTGKGKAVPVLNYIPCHEDILCLIKHHAIKIFGGVET